MNKDLDLRLLFVVIGLVLGLTLPVPHAQPAPIAPIIGWDASADVTIEGYTVAWGSVSRVYTQTADVPATGTQYGPVPLLDATKPWYFAIRSWRTDASGIGRVMSPWTAEVCAAPTGMTCTPATTQQPYAPGKPVLLALMDPSTPAAKPLSLVWSVQTATGTTPNWNIQIRPHYDPFALRTWWHLTRNNAGSIYSTDLFYRTAAAIFGRLGGTGTTSLDCSLYPLPGTQAQWSDGSTSDRTPWLADRHPDGQNAVDTTHGYYYQWSGIACSNAPAGDGIGYNDLWRLKLNADPATDTWTKLSPATIPAVQYGGSLAWHAAHDVLVLHGKGGQGDPETWIYCPTTTTLSAVQTAAGCTVANDWKRTYDALSDLPALSYQPVLIDSPEAGKVLMFGAYCEQGAGWCPNALWATTVWAYDVEAKTWTNRNPANPPMNQQATFPEVLFARITTIGPNLGKILMHRTSHRGTTAGQARDFIYDPVANTWADLGVSAGIGPEKYAHVAYDPTVGSKGGFPAMEVGAGIGSAPVWWQAVIQ